MGKIVPYEQITAETMADAIRFALEPQTQENARKVAHSYRNRIQTPQEAAVWWVEHVAATGGAALMHSHATEMSALAYYSFDVYATLAAVFVVFVGSWVWALKRCCRSRSSGSAAANKLKSQ